jgi:diguanylate cyclase (GGDEF)-like protein/PAS domain S-box-containing protein
VKSSIAITFGLLVVISLLFFAEYTKDEVQAHNSATQADFRSLNIIHSSIEKDILKLQANKIKNFDNIAKLISQQRSTLINLKKETSVLLKSDYQEFTAMLVKYQRSYERVISLIDHYKRNFAFTKNSLIYSTHLSRELIQKLPERATKGSLHLLNSEILQFLTNDNPQNAENINTRIQTIKQDLAATDHPLTATFDVLAKHLAVLLKGKMSTNQNLTQIFTSPHLQLLDKSYRYYMERQSASLQKHHRYIDLLLLCSLLLVLVFLRSIYQLITNSGKLANEKRQLQESVFESKESLQQTNLELKREIQQRVEAEDQLQNAAIFYEHCNEGVVICNKDKKAISTNPAFTVITGIMPEILIGNLPSIFDAKKLPEVIFQDINNSIDNTGKWHGEVYTINADHQKTPKEVSIISLKKNALIYRYIIIITDISERKKNEETIYLQANYDPLTQLPNRHLFDERAKHTLGHARRNNSRFAVLFIDIDNFKKINDTLGHPVGDELLIELAARLRDSIRETDTVSRFGGDEFIILLEGVDQSYQVQKVVDKLMLCLSAPIKTLAETLHVSGSMGIAIYPEDGLDIPTLIRCADISMYKAKQQGKNTYCFFEDEMNIAVHESLALETQLRSAIANQELYLEYQPIIESENNTLYAVEALVRWNHTSKGRIAPDKFIPIAEESGLILPIGEWILRTACQQLADWNEFIKADMKMSINVSTVQMKDREFANVLKNIIRETAIVPENLNLEITESLFIEDSDSHIFSTLQNLREQGISISLDDFGTGYSSLSYLKRFPVNVLKIDRSFINEMTNNENDQLLVEAIINMAKSLKMKVVAEGVETEQQQMLLMQYQCNYFQGYYFSKPKSADEIELSLTNLDKLNNSTI